VPPPSNAARVKSPEDQQSREERVQARLDVPLTIAAALVIPLIVLEETHQGEPWRTIATLGNWVVWLVFAAELVTMLVVVRARRRWLWEHPLELVIVVLTPPFVPIPFQSVRVLRLLRLLRGLRLAPLARRFFSAQGVRLVGLVVFLSAIAGAVVFSSLEGGSFANGLYWSAQNMTAVGASVHAHTVGGKVLGVALTIVGLGFIAVLTGALAERFLAHNPRARLTAAEEDASLQELRALNARIDRLQNELQSPRG
jgi:voltage-gated potassium channel